jgi:RNA polymerase sigma factor (sigma-70 family)
MATRAGTTVARALRTAVGAGAVGDRELLRRFADANDQKAFAALVARHSGMVLGVCRRELGCPQDAEDACQATFLLLARKAPGGRWQPSLANWLYTTARQVARNARRAALRRVKREGRAAVPEAVQPLDRMTGRELLAALDEELEKLPPRYRGPLVLCYLEGLTRDEAARRLGVPAATLKVQLERGRQRLHRALTARGASLGAGLLAVAVTSPAGASPPRLVESVLAAASGPVPDAVAALAEGVAVNGLLNKLALLALALAGAAALGIGLGSVTLTAAEKQTAGPVPAKGPFPDNPMTQAAAPAPPPITVSGRVFDSDGRPVSGAKVRLWSEGTKDGAAVRATTGPDGRFHFAAGAADAGSGAIVAASAERFGPGWVRLGEPAPGDLTLRLPKDDVPIAGRVLTLEGRPVAGMTVRVSSLAAGADGAGLGPWVEAQKREAGSAADAVSLTTLPAEATGLPTVVTTGEDGRFRLTGFGRERVVHLQMRGRGVETVSLDVMTRVGPDPGIPSHLRNATFDCLVGPARTIVGTVRDGRTGRPLAGIKVHCPPGETFTDDQGRYRLDGVAKQPTYWVAAGGLPYFFTLTGVADAPGLEALTADFALERGLVVRGRLTDRATGKPIRGRVMYLADRANPALKDFPDFGKDFSTYKVPGGETRPDGSFEILALPGPGWLGVTAEDAERYVGAEVADWRTFLSRALPRLWWVGRFHAVVAINPSGDDLRSLTRAVALEPGRTVTGTLVGPARQPVAGAYAAGLTPGFSGRRPPVGLTTAEFCASGLSAQKTGKLVFFHPGLKLGKVQPVRPEETGPLTVRLEPLGAITGRVLDANGRPWAGLKVRVGPSHNISDYTDLPAELLDKLAQLLGAEVTTDHDGRFRVEDLLPGLKYSLTADPGARRQGAAPAFALDTVPVTSGRTADLGDLKSRATPGD